MACNGSFATPEDYAAFWCTVLGSDEEETTVQNYLDIAVSDIHGALAASGACDCTLASWATTLLKKLNIVDAAIFHKCPCGAPLISDDMRRAYLEWMNLQLELIRTGKLELCDGETGADFPVTGWAQQGLTEFNKAQIIVNDIVENS
jgi:hypothetical protein